MAKARQGGAPMIVMQRIEDESLVIGDDIILTVIEVREDEVQVRIEYPEGVAVHPGEVYEALQSHARTVSETRPGS
jgi:carbon storage regulator